MHPLSSRSILTLQVVCHKHLTVCLKSVIFTLVCEFVISTSAIECVEWDVKLCCLTNVLVLQYVINVVIIYLWTFGLQRKSEDDKKSRGDDAKSSRSHQIPVKQVVLYFHMWLEECCGYKWLAL